MDVMEAVDGALDNVKNAMDNAIQEQLLSNPTLNHAHALTLTLNYKEGKPCDCYKYFIRFESHNQNCRELTEK